MDRLFATKWRWNLKSHAIGNWGVTKRFAHDAENDENLTDDNNDLLFKSRSETDEEWTFSKSFNFLGWEALINVNRYLLIVYLLISGNFLTRLFW